MRNLILFRSDALRTEEHGQFCFPWLEAVDAWVASLQAGARVYHAHDDHKW